MRGVGDLSSSGGRGSSLGRSRTYNKVTYLPRLTMIKNKEGETLVRKEEILERWAEYFENLLNRDEPDRPLEEVEGLESELEEPPDEEIRQVVRSLKKNKAPGTDLVQVDILLVAGEPVMSWLVALVKEMWEERADAGEVERS